MDDFITSSTKNVVSCQYRKINQFKLIPVSYLIKAAGFLRILLISIFAGRINLVSEIKQVIKSQKKQMAKISI